jgi:plastocyanin
MMRRFFTLLLVTPLLASCSESVTPVAPSDAAFTLEESPIVASESQVGPWTLGESESVFGELTPEEWGTPLESTPEESPLQVAPSTGAVMYFGQPNLNAGSDYFPPGSHDESYHGRDRVLPGTVTIDAGQKVTFRVLPGHRVAIYKPGKRPEDVVVNPASFFLFDPTQRIALQAAPVPVISFTFIVPGRYLVICAITPHFVNANMYGWVIVR